MTKIYRSEPHYSFAEGDGPNIEQRISIKTDSLMQKQMQQKELISKIKSAMAAKGITVPAMQAKLEKLEKGSAGESNPVPKSNNRIANMNNQLDSLMGKELEKRTLISGLKSAIQGATGGAKDPAPLDTVEEKPEPYANKLQEEYNRRDDQKNSNLGFNRLNNDLGFDQELKKRQEEKTKKFKEKRRVEDSESLDRSYNLDAHENNTESPLPAASSSKSTGMDKLSELLPDLTEEEAKDVFARRTDKSVEKAAKDSTNNFYKLLQGFLPYLRTTRGKNGQES